MRFRLVPKSSTVDDRAANDPALNVSAHRAALNRGQMVATFTFEIGSLSNVLRISVGVKLQENRAY